MDYKIKEIIKKLLIEVFDEEENVVYDLSKLLDGKNKQEKQVIIQQPVCVVAALRSIKSTEWLNEMVPMSN